MLFCPVCVPELLEFDEVSGMVEWLAVPVRLVVVVVAVNVFVVLVEVLVEV